MAPTIERKKTSVGSRTIYYPNRVVLSDAERRAVMSGTLSRAPESSSLLDPQGVLNTEGVAFETAAESLGVSVKKLIEKVRELKVGDSIEW